MFTAFLLLAWTIPTADAAPTYERDVKPILVKRCTVCHNAASLTTPTYPVVSRWIRMRRC